MEIRCVDCQKKLTPMGQLFAWANLRAAEYTENDKRGGITYQAGEHFESGSLAVVCWRESDGKTFALGTRIPHHVLRTVTRGGEFHHNEFEPIFAEAIKRVNGKVDDHRHEETNDVQFVTQEH